MSVDLLVNQQTTLLGFKLVVSDSCNVEVIDNKLFNNPNYQTIVITVACGN